MSYPARMLAALRQLESRPILLAALIGLAAEALFLINLGHPTHIYFDEVHYVSAARTLLSLTGPQNVEHPLLGKEIIGAGIALFGDNPWGWRLPSTFAASLTVMAGFAFVRLLTGATKPAVVAALLMLLNQMVFVQARIAMLDGFLAMFLCGAMVMLLSAMRAPTPAQTHLRWIAGAVLLGLATAVKWAAIPYVALAGLTFVALRIAEHWQAAPGDALRAAIGSGPHRRWPGLPLIRGLLLLGAVSIPVYFLTFIPTLLYDTGASTLAGLIPLQREMYSLQTQILPGHTYQSSWWSWPLMIRPIWYFYEADDGAQRGVLLIGNPLIMWGGLVAVIAGFVVWFRERARLPLAMSLLWTASVAIYIIIPKSLGFYYYYYLSSIFLCFALAVWFHHADKGRGRRDAEWFVAGSLALFIYFYPILAATPLPGEQSFNDWMWFPSWR